MVIIYAFVEERFETTGWKPMLLAILPSEVRGGVEEYVLTICVAAVHNGWSVHVAFPHRQEMISLERDFLKAGISYHPLEISERANHDLETNKRDLERFWRTIKLLLKVRPDLVQISLPWPDKCFGSIMACSLFKVKTVVTFHLIPHPFFIYSEAVEGLQLGTAP